MVDAEGDEGQEDEKHDDDDGDNVVLLHFGGFVGGCLGVVVVSGLWMCVLYVFISRLRSVLRSRIYRDIEERYRSRNRKRNQTQLRTGVLMQYKVRRIAIRNSSRTS